MPSIDDEVRAAWATLEPLFEPYGAATPSTLEAIEGWLRRRYAAILGEAEVERRLELPEDVVAFHRLVDRARISQRLGGWDFTLYGRAYGTDEEEAAAEDAEAAAAVRAVGMWHPMGRYNDNHELWVCIDCDQEEWGQVFDLQDQSPWFNDRLVPDVITPSWAVFLARLAARAEQRKAAERSQPVPRRNRRFWRRG